MELHQIRYFLSLCEELNSRVPRSVAVSHSLAHARHQALEQELGGALFHRERANTHLVQARAEGKTVLDQAYVTWRVRANRRRTSCARRPRRCASADERLRRHAFAACGRAARAPSGHRACQITDATARRCRNACLAAISTRRFTRCGDRERRKGECPGRFIASPSSLR